MEDLDVTVTEQLPAFPFPAAQRDPFTPVPERDLPDIDAPPIRVAMPDGTPAWLVTRHADVREMLRDTAFSADLARPGFPLIRPLPPSAKQNRQGAFIRMDGEEHQRLRRMLTGEFTIKNIRRWEPLIQQTVDRAVDAMRDAGPPADLVERFAMPVPSMVICHLLGVPYADHEFFQSRSRTLLARSVALENITRAGDELRAYLGELIDTKRGRHDEDLLGRLVTERLETGEVSREELVGVALLLLIAGHETTANMIGLSVLLLLDDPGRWAALGTDPALVTDTVEELLRYLTIVRSGLGRVALRDTEVGGRPIRAGEGAIALLAAANRDDAVFPDADGFDPRREAHQHIAFGFGVHQCLGQPLARAELRIALAGLARRFPTLHTSVTAATASIRDNAIILGLAELPVTW